MSVLEGSGNGIIQQLAYVGQIVNAVLVGPAHNSGCSAYGRQAGRWVATIRQMAEMGVDALSVIATVSMSTGFILGAEWELRRFGSLSLAVDIIAIGFIRELSPLLSGRIWLPC